MKKKIVYFSLLSLALVGCDQADKKSTPHQTYGEISYEADSYDADNTGRNDVEGAKTPFDQSENDVDRNITKKIRQTIVSDDNLSTNAKNVKIITEKKGFVTLRGAVNNEHEKELIASKAQDVPGVVHVENQIEIIKNK